MSGFFAGNGSSRLTLTSRHPCILGSFTIPAVTYKAGRLAHKYAKWNDGTTCDLKEYIPGSKKYADFVAAHGKGLRADYYDVLVDHATKGTIDIGSIEGDFFTLPPQGVITTPILSYSNGVVSWAYGPEGVSSGVEGRPGSGQYVIFPGESYDYGVDPGAIIPAVTITYGAR